MTPTHIHITGWSSSDLETEPENLPWFRISMALSIEHDSESYLQHCNSPSL